MDWIELNEAFAAQSLAVINTLGLDPTKVNPMGGAIALGHPLGATGAIRAATVVHALRRHNLKYGMVTMCVGMGKGAAGIFERVQPIACTRALRACTRTQSGIVSSASLAKPVEVEVGGRLRVASLATRKCALCDRVAPRGTGMGRRLLRRTLRLCTRSLSRRRTGLNCMRRRSATPRTRVPGRSDCAGDGS